MKDRPPPDSSEYTKWLKEKANLELTIADARMGIPIYERHSIISQIPSSLSLRRSVLSLFNKNNIFRESFALSSIGGLSLWLDASDYSSLTLSGSSVTQWNDKSGNRFNMSNIPSFLMPTYNATGFNGNPTVSFVRNASGYPSALENAEFSFTSKSLTLFFISQRIGSGAKYQRFISTTNTTNNDYNNSESFTVDSGDLNKYLQFDRNNNNINSEFTTTNPFMGELIVNGTGTTVGNFNTLANYIYANGSQLASTTDAGLAAGASFNILRVRLGAAAPAGALNDGGFSSFHGNMSEVLLFNRVLTTSEFTSVEGYLAWKWGLQSSLPSNHPYFSAKP